MPIRKPILTGLILELTLAPNLWADADSEREALAKLLHELSALESLIGKAEARRQQDARIRFRYDWLRKDLDRIKSGIKAHIDGPRVQPRSYPPLRGDYRR